MKKIKFPIIKKDDRPFYPTEDKCPICGTDRTTLNSEFFVLNGGAMKKIDEDMSMMSDDLEGFLSLNFHTHEPCKKNASVNIVELSRNGQFDIHFCSIECLQEFFNQIVENIKSKIV